MKNIERYLPYLLSLGAIFVLRILKLDSIRLDRFDIIISSLITVTITIIGFILTIITIFIAIGDTKTFKAIKNENYIKDLNQYLISPILFGIVLLLFCFYLAAVIKSDLLLSKINLYVFVFLLVLEVTSVIRVAFIMYLTFNSVMIESKNSNEVKEAKGEDAFN